MDIEKESIQVLPLVAVRKERMKEEIRDSKDDNDYDTLPKE